MDETPITSPQSIISFEKPTVPPVGDNQTPTPKRRLSKSLIIGVILFVLFLSVTLTGVLFLTAQKKNESRPVTSLHKQDSIKENVPQANLNNKVLFIGNSGKLFISDVNGENREAFNSGLDKYKLSAAGSSIIQVSPNHQYVLTSGYRTQGVLDNSYHYFVLSVNDRTYEEIDIAKMIKKFHYSSYYTSDGPFFWHWTEDSKNLVYSAAIKKEKLPGTIRRVIGLYNIQTQDATEIYSEEKYKTEFYPSYWGVVYFDQKTQQVLYTDDDADSLKDTYVSERMRGRIIDLRTNKKTVLIAPNISTTSSRPVGKYSLMGTQSSDPCQNKSLSLTLSLEPEKNITTFKVPEESSLIYDSPWVYWSSDYTHVALRTQQAVAPKPGQLELCYVKGDNQYWFYTKEGNLMAKADVPSFNMYTQVVFSPDNMQAIIMGANAKGSNSTDWETTWKLVNLSKDNDVVHSITAKELGRIIYWY